MATGSPPGTLVLLRHGESTWNVENLFTGWTDVPLSERGMQEAREAGRLMKDAGLRPAVVHESVLIRAIQTTQLALAEMEMAWVPVKRSWRLNERHYGALQGLNKRQTSDEYGEAKVKLWRRGYDVRPPDLDPSDRRHPAHDPRYAALPPELLPAAECLKDVVERMLPYWYDAIVPDLLLHPCVLVSAHGNSLRALVKHLDGLSEEEVVELNIPTGVPRVYELAPDFQPRSWRYLGDPAEIERRAAAVKAQASGSKSPST
jgi:2,3-bisphosphoglycerate-dependent phosphoglycerate mutase